MFYFLILIALIYIVLILFFIKGFNHVSNFKLTENNNHRKFTIIIPFRNEANNISLLANSLEQIDYPNSHFEVLFINDGSNDNSVPLLTEFIIKNPNWKLLDNQRKSKSPKKDAIDTAIKQAKFDWIITTDADCIVPKKWLQIFSDFMNSHKENSCLFIAAPVSYKVNTSFLHQFQLIDFLSLIGTTIGSFGVNKPFMCNGANLCYHKQTFIDLNGFEGNNNIASGDDVFLLEKFVANNPNQVYYLKANAALVITQPENTFKGLINQRIRWASKTSNTNNNFAKLIGVEVFLENIVLLWSIFFGIWHTEIRLMAVFIILSKFVVDYLLINKAHLFVHQKMKFKNYLLSSLLYPFFVVYIVVKSQFTKVVWKDRVFNN